VDSASPAFILTRCPAELLLLAQEKKMKARVKLKNKAAIIIHPVKPVAVSSV
jgi:hypothetical protein